MKLCSNISIYFIISVLICSNLAFADQRVTTKDKYAVRDIQVQIFMSNSRVFLFSTANGCVTRSAPSVISSELTQPISIDSIGGIYSSIESIMGGLYLSDGYIPRGEWIGVTKLYQIKPGEYTLDNIHSWSKKGLRPIHIGSVKKPGIDSSIVRDVVLTLCAPLPDVEQWKSAIAQERSRHIRSFFVRYILEYSYSQGFYYPSELYNKGDDIIYYANRCENRRVDCEIFINMAFTGATNQ